VKKNAKIQFYQLCHSISYLHSMNVCHRDLKLANILLMSPGSSSLLKICDFGLSKQWTPTNMLQTVCGTPSFMAPEVIVMEMLPYYKSSYSCKSDCWSMGVILYLLLSGQEPFDVLGPSLNHQIRTGNFKPMRGGVWNRISVHAKDLVKKLLVVDPDKRLSANDMLLHNWFVKDKATCSRAHDIMFGSENGKASNDVNDKSSSGLCSSLEQHVKIKSKLCLRTKKPIYATGEKLKNGKKILVKKNKRIDKVPINKVKNMSKLPSRSVVLISSSSSSKENKAGRRSLVPNEQKMKRSTQLSQEAKKYVLSKLRSRPVVKYLNSMKRQRKVKDYFPSPNHHGNPSKKRQRKVTDYFKKPL